MNFEQKIATYIHQHHLLQPGDKVLIGLSGGADSVALLLSLTTLGYSCEAAHCNFHLRGEESDRDERFVTALCATRGIRLHRVDFDTEAYANNHKISIEMAARELRYRWFATLKSESEAAAIAIAHHQDDSIETMLLNLLRGTGLKGLLGIQVHNGDIIRPLLCVSRAEILHYLKEQEQPYVTDSTNLQNDYTRNKIRLNLLPLMQQINPSAANNLLDTLQNLNEAMKVYTRQIDEGKQRVMQHDRILISALLEEPSPEALLHEILSPHGFTSAQIADITGNLQGQSGKQYTSKTGYRVIKDRNCLLLSPTMEPTSCPPLLTYRRYPLTADFVIPRERHTICIDADKLSGELHVRRYRTGDIFVPFGMKGRKKVSDYLTDRKYSLLQKEALWVLCSGDDIVWLIGERLDNRFCISPSTRHILQVDLKG